MLDLIRLAELRENVNAAEWMLLMALAAGVAYYEMTGMTAGGARTRVARLRARQQIAGQESPEHPSESSRR
jgi:hypothetical protein